MSAKTSYIVGHYVQYYVSRDFHKDFTHEDYESALSSFRHLCLELPAETEVEIRKQTTESILSRQNISDFDLERWRIFDQS